MKKQNQSIVRDKVPTPRASVGGSGRFRRAANSNDLGQDRRKDSGQATHENARQATRVTGRKVDVTEKAARIRDAHGIRKERGVEARQTNNAGSLITGNCGL